MFDKILIANRGEIACRIIKTAKRMGIDTIAVYSDADKNARHVQMADEAYALGASESQKSYLNFLKIINIAKKSNALAIHPGYGFLSENTDFAKECEKQGIIFIGPPSRAINAMGSKQKSKEILDKENIPLVPGYHGKEQSLAALADQAKHIGFPLLIKASSGGGGKGMRLVHDPAEFKIAVAATQREAKSSFNDEILILEKYMAKPRHIEIQIFADQHDNVVYLFERDCSIQRRHQKIIEEAPAPGISERLREALGETAIKIARTIGYVGAGTIEFLVDSKENFYFLEMNTRLQVEHPITEMICGVDLVEWQLRIANGESLPKKQSELSINGHAIEVRIYAEDCGRDFLPSTGKIIHLQTPEENNHTRIDSGIQNGDEISIYYDPMIAKLIVWENKRTTAIRKLQHALKKYQIAGVKTNINFLQNIVSNTHYLRGKINTDFINQYQKSLFNPEQSITAEEWALATLYCLLTQTCNSVSPWDKKDAWQMNLDHRQIIQFMQNNQLVDVHIKMTDNGYELSIAGKKMVKVHGEVRNGNLLTAFIDDQRIDATIIKDRLTLTVFAFGRCSPISLFDPEVYYAFEDAQKTQLNAPMPGTVVAVMTKKGEKVNPGDSLIIIEAMKMEHTIHAPTAGIIKDIHFKIGDQVTEGTELIALEGNDT